MTPKAAKRTGHSYRYRTRFLRERHRNAKSLTEPKSLPGSGEISGDSREGDHLRRESEGLVKSS